MIKGIMAVDEKGGISKGPSMPWPKNPKDLKWFKENTLNNVVIMGRKTWEDPFMPTPLKSRTNILITSKDRSLFPGADYYFSENIIQNITRRPSSPVVCGRQALPNSFVREMYTLPSTTKLTNG